MNLAIDHGNTHIKIGLFEASKIQSKYVFEEVGDLQKFLAHREFDNAIVSSVVRSSDRLLSSLSAAGHVIQVDNRTPLPIKAHYKTYDTLGSDRMAIACGIAEQTPGQNCLAVSIGTCVTFDLVSAQPAYYGGSISPGIKMRYQALHTFTSKLPLLAPKYPTDLVGDSTEACMHSGVMGGLLAEIEKVIALYKERYSHLQIIMCGGDSHWFEEKLSGNVLVVPDLVLIGLNSILRYNIDQ